MIGVPIFFFFVKQKFKKQDFFFFNVKNYPLELEPGVEGRRIRG